MANSIILENLFEAMRKSIGNVKEYKAKESELNDLLR